MFRRLAIRYDPPHLVAHIIRNQQGSRAVNGNANGPPHRLAVGIEKARQNILRTTRGLAVREWHENNPVSRRWFAIPRAVLTDKGPVPVGRREQNAG